MVEVDVGPAVREPPRLGRVPGAGGVPPGPDQGIPLGLAVGVGGDVSGAGVCVQARGDVPGAQLVQRGPFPAVGLAAVLGQGDGGQLAGQGAECSAGGELGELAVVPDEYELPAGLGGDAEELGEVAGAEHAGLVDDQHPAGG